MIGGHMRHALNLARLLAVATASLATLTSVYADDAAAARASEVSPEPLATVFRDEVTTRLEVPIDEQHYYARRLEMALQPLEPDTLPAQYIALIDRNPHVQAFFLYRLAPPPATGSRSSHFIGASPVSTGKPGRVDYFQTPLGIFDHTVANMDFRAEGTFNKNGIRGYGLKGMRVYDLGWAYAKRGWGTGAYSVMRLQMHATDPDYLEPRLGEAASKGCIRIPASLNTFLDRHGVLDADYEGAMAGGVHLWVMRMDRTPVADPGRYVVIIDSERGARPEWSPRPTARVRTPPH